MNFFHKESKSKKKFFFFFFLGGGGGGGRAGGRWMDRRTGPHLFAPSTFSKLGPKQCINVQVMSLTSSIYDHFII